MGLIIVLASIIIIVAVLAVVAVAASRQRTAAGQRGGSLAGIGRKIDLEQLACQNCGAELDRSHVIMDNGVALVSCPYCGSEYRMVD